MNRRVYRSRSQLVLGIVMVVLFDGFAIGLILEHPDRVRTPVIGGIFILANTFIGARVAAAAIIASDSGIRVRNIFSSLDLKWDEIQRFDIGRWKLLPYVCLIHLRDGNVKHAFGIEESTNFPNESAKRMTDELNEELARRRPGGTGNDLQIEVSPGSAQNELFRTLGNEVSGSS